MSVRQHGFLAACPAVNDDTEGEAVAANFLAACPAVNVQRRGP